MKILSPFFISFSIILMMSRATMPSDNESNASIASIIEYSKQRDIYFFELQKRVHDLWTSCIMTRDLSDSNYHRTYTYVNPRASLKMLQDLYTSRQELQNFQKNTEADIAQLIVDGQSIHAVDEHGNTGLDYVRSRLVYNALRSQGADFHILPFLSFNAWYIGAAAIPTTLIALGLYQALSPYSSNEQINDKDSFGRTVLMNYVIEQEKILPAMIQARNLHVLESKIQEIRDAIWVMIKQGADIHSKDYQGKTVLDYCKTPFMHDACVSYTLRKSEKRMKLNPYLFFGSVILSVYAVIGCAIALPEKTAEDGFDRWYQQRYL